MKNKKILVIISLIVILVIAAFFRLWQLDSIPPGLYPDEAINGNEALDSLETGKFKAFYPENNGREGLFIWLIAFSFSIFGPSIWALKIVPAIFGILTVLGLYLLTKELLFQSHENSSRGIGLLGSFFLAISFWHTNFSRIGFRAILVPFSLVFAFYFLFRGFRTKGRAGLPPVVNLIVSGIFFAFGFYTYISYRFVIFILATALFSWWLVCKREKLQKKFIHTTCYLLLTTFIVALPIGIYFLQNPQDFFGRASKVSVFSQPNPIYEIGKSLIVHLQMFNLWGDGNWRHNFASSPMLLWPIGIFFLIGLILTIKNLINYRKNKDCFMFHISCFMISWFFFMLMPGVLSSEAIPHALRTIGTIPVVYIFAGLGVFWLFKKLKIFYKTKGQVIVFALIIFIFLFSLTYSQFDKYFFQWAKKDEVKNAFSLNYVKIGRYLNSLPNSIHSYVIVNQAGVPVPFPNGLPMPAQTPIFIERTIFSKPRAIYLKPEDLDISYPLKMRGDEKLVYIPLRYDESLIKKLKEKIPNGILKKINNFWIYEARPTIVP